MLRHYVRSQATLKLHLALRATPTYRLHNRSPLRRFSDSPDEAGSESIAHNVQRPAYTVIELALLDPAEEIDPSQKVEASKSIGSLSSSKHVSSTLKSAPLTQSIFNEGRAKQKDCDSTESKVLAKAESVIEKIAKESETTSTLVRRVSSRPIEATETPSTELYTQEILRIAGAFKTITGTLISLAESTRNATIRATNSLARCREHLASDLRLQDGLEELGITVSDGKIPQSIESQRAVVAKSGTKASKRETPQSIESQRAVVAKSGTKASKAGTSRSIESRRDEVAKFRTIASKAETSQGIDSQHAKDKVRAARETKKTLRRHLRRLRREKETPRSEIGQPSRNKMESFMHTSEKVLTSDEIALRGVNVDQRRVKRLCYKLDRVLFMQGPYNLQDPRTGVFNFNPYLQDIMPIEEFDFESLSAFVPSSQDDVLQKLARKHKQRYVSSTSSMTGALSHFHFLLSDFRPLNFARLSSKFPAPLTSFTALSRAPTAMYLTYKDGVYSLSADKTFDRGTVLSQLGQSMEKLLLLPQEKYELYRLSNPEKISSETRNAPEAYHYSILGNFLCRAQLDGFHPQLPGSGIFDIKTRACVTIRMNQSDYKTMSGYQIRGLYGEWESYEREYADMLRSAMLKYSLQVRLGRMDGIFVAFHNTEQIFGFQYIPLSEMDLAIHGQENLALGDQEFKLSMQLLSDVFDLITAQYPKQSIRIHLDTIPDSNGPSMRVFAEPVDETSIEAAQAVERKLAMQELQGRIADTVDEPKDSVSLLSGNEPSLSSGNNGTDSSSSEQSVDSGNAEAMNAIPIPTEHNGTDSSSSEQTVDSGNAEAMNAIPIPTGHNDTDQTNNPIYPNTESTHHSTPENKAEPGHSDVATILEPARDAGASSDLSDYQLPLGSEGSRAETSGSDQALLDKAMDSAMLDGWDASHITDKAPSNSSYAAVPILSAFHIKVSHSVDEKSVRQVSNINYLEPWPLPHVYMAKGQHMKSPSVDKSWKLTYKIRQYEDPLAQRLYQECKRHRAQKLGKLQTGTDPLDKAFSKLLRQWSEKGRNSKVQSKKLFNGEENKRAWK